jgi:hypothetical protein
MHGVRQIIALTQKWYANGILAKVDTVAHIPHPNTALFGNIAISHKAWRHETL